MIKFAITGLGHIGKRHAEMIQNNDECTLVAVIDTDEAVRSLLAEQYPALPVFATLEHYFESGISADVLTIATPNGYHTTQALQALDHGMHVVIEKPMALTTSQAEEVILKAKNKNKQVFCVMQNRYSPPSEWLKGIVEQGLLGKRYMVQINCYWNRDDRYYKSRGWHGTKALDGGTLFTQFSHFIDLMYWLFGDIKNIQARLNDFNHAHLTDFEDSGMATFDFVNGGMGCFNFSTSVWDKNLESSMTIIAENGTVKVGGQYMEKVEYSHIKNYTLPALPDTNPPNDYGPYKGSAANHHFIIENVVDTLKGGGSVTTNAHEGLKVVDIIERIYAAGRGK